MGRARGQDYVVACAPQAGAAGMLAWAVAGTHEERLEAKAAAWLCYMAATQGLADYMGALASYMACAIGYPHARELVRDHIGAIVTLYVKAEGEETGADVC